MNVLTRSSPPQRQKRQKNSSSKYDFVKVRVHLSEQHYYVLSRFLLCRMLTAAKIDYNHALRIALDLKKRLVDKEQLDVSQEALQSELFELMKKHGYGTEHVRWYKTMASFHHQRIPLIVLIAGTGYTGKSTIATALSERLNVSSVLKTDAVYELVHIIKEGNCPGSLWDLAGDDFNATIDRESVLVCKGMNANLYKSVTDGKSIIIEGSLVNHVLLEWLLSVIQENQNAQHPVIVAPFLLIREEASLQQHTKFESCTFNFERIRDYQQELLKLNVEKQQTSPLQVFHVVHVDMDNINSAIDTIQRNVLSRIAKQVEA